MPIPRYMSPETIRLTVRNWQREGLTVGFVPTMGALHEGHLSLVRASAEECDRTVISIYVNPTQFAPDEDLDSYPRRLDEDCAIAEEAGADAVFCPDDEEMYPDGFATSVVQTGLTQVLEGASRPRHFCGVLTVVCKLLGCVPAERAYFGQKDFQQATLIHRMMMDLNIGTGIRVMPIVREPDGLAMSSRNAYLDADERAQACCLWQALEAARRLYADGERDANAARAAMGEIIADAPLAEPDYIEVVNAHTLEPVVQLDAETIAVLAVRFGETRLIDNAILA
jgi:pantoate--beta-alanine ligase